SQAPTGFQDAKGLAVRGFLIGAQVDDAVGNYDVGEAVGKLHTPQAGDDKLGRFRRVRLGCRLLRPLDHVRSEIHAYRLAARADLVGGKHYVDAGATSEVHDCLARSKIGESGWVTASSGEGEGALGD